MRKLLIATLISMVLGGAGGFAATYVTQVKANSDGSDGCPAGSYNIGISKDDKPLCKLEPTGCPYGDSIPLDSSKCAPPADPESAYAPWNPQPVEQPSSTLKPAETPSNVNVCGK